MADAITLDVTFFRSHEGEIKIGEIKVASDGSLEGFLFDSPTLLRVIEEMPNSVTFSVILHPAVPAKPAKPNKANPAKPDGAKT